MRKSTVCWRVRKGNSPIRPQLQLAKNLAFILLQASAFMSPPEASTSIVIPQVSQADTFASLPVGFQVSLDLPSGPKTSLNDIDALISTLEARSGGTQGQSIDELQREINQSKAELEQERAKERELESSRDIAWGHTRLLLAK